MKHAKRVHQKGSKKEVNKQDKTAPPFGRCQFNPQEYKIVTLRECTPVNDRNLCDNPDSIFKYWQLNIETAPWFNPDAECLVAILLDVRRKAKGHALISIGLLDNLLFHAREAFRAAVIGAASAIVLMHNHPSGDPEPSEADVRATRKAVESGKVVGIEVLDHIIAGAGNYVSLRERGLGGLEPFPKGKPSRRAKAIARAFAALAAAKTPEQTTRAGNRISALNGIPLRTETAPVQAKAA